MLTRFSRGDPQGIFMIYAYVSLPNPLGCTCTFVEPTNVFDTMVEVQGGEGNNRGPDSRYRGGVPGADTRDKAGPRGKTVSRGILGVPHYRCYSKSFLVCILTVPCTGIRYRIIAYQGTCVSGSLLRESTGRQ